MIRKGFGDNVLLLPLPEDGNHIVFAFRDPGFEPRWRWIGEQAGAMRARYGLDGPERSLRDVGERGRSPCRADGRWPP